MGIIDTYADRLLDRYSAYPQGRFVSLFLVRCIQSEAIFRTEGAGEPLNKEFVFAGERAGNDDIIQRVVISKRKQTAVERRTGRELLREHALLRTTSKGTVCSLNSNNPCEKCIDCMLYGYAAGGGGSQRSRIVTDDAFSLHPAVTVTGMRHFNALFDTSTMRHPDTQEQSAGIGSDEYVRPETIFFDIETLKDVTPDELRYVLGNVLRSMRYGGLTSRIGKVRNHLLGVAFSNCELFSNLEWVQRTYDEMRGTAREPAFPVHVTVVGQHAYAAAESLRERVVGQIEWLSQHDISALLAEISALYAQQVPLTTMLERLASSYPKQ
ncbi:MAG: hypothetical protein NVS4B8_26630 [Herpetosiphon sp.]